MTRQNIRRIFAAAFLLFFLAEWGTHALMHTGQPKDGETVVSTRGDSHGHPGHSIFLCNDSRRSDQQIPGFSHDITPNAMLDLLSDLNPRIDVESHSPLPFLDARALLRPTCPPLPPPELS